MKTIYNTHTKHTYILNEKGKIVNTYVPNRITKCRECNKKASQIIQRGKYAGLCIDCKRKKYYADNREKELANNRKNYHTRNGLVRMKERWFGGNYIKVLTRDNFQCQICGSTKKLNVHHKDRTGIKNVGSYKLSNNSMDNLITLCASCHTSYHNGKIKSPLLEP
ncbi:MAG: HNH endonuclease [Chitinophagales bacterium]|nr:HNH endonuclease [Chitinophagales bacterium]